MGKNVSLSFPPYYGTRFHRSRKRKGSVALWGICDVPLNDDDDLLPLNEKTLQGQ